MGDREDWQLDGLCLVKAAQGLVVVDACCSYTTQVFKAIDESQSITVQRGIFAC